MRAVENLQDMHGMKEKYMEKTVDKIESKSVTLIDDITKEEAQIAASRTTTKELDECSNVFKVLLEAWRETTDVAY